MRGGKIVTMISNKLCYKTKQTLELLSLAYEILVVGLTLSIGQVLPVVNAYFPSGVHDTRPLDTPISTCGGNVLLAGYFNTCHITWGEKTDMWSR